MNILFPIILISILIALGFLAAFFWAVGDGQYEDDYTPSIRMLFDENGQTKERQEESNQTLDKDR
ncbi:MAG: cbb3-type cytochrome oxidase assembly protein CcoS [Bacteroidota bacterium]